MIILMHSIGHYTSRIDTNTEGSYLLRHSEIQYMGRIECPRIDAGARWIGLSCSIRAGRRTFGRLFPRFPLFRLNPSGRAEHKDSSQITLKD